jgi:hypothetical protein
LCKVKEPKKGIFLKTTIFFFFFLQKKKKKKKKERKKEEEEEKVWLNLGHLFLTAYAHIS